MTLVLMAHLRLVASLRVLGRPLSILVLRVELRVVMLPFEGIVAPAQAALPLATGLKLMIQDSRMLFALIALLQVALVRTPVPPAPPMLVLVVLLRATTPRGLLRLLRVVRLPGVLRAVSPLLVERTLRTLWSQISSGGSVENVAE